MASYNPAHTESGNMLRQISNKEWKGREGNFDSGWARGSREGGKVITTMGEKGKPI